MPTTLSKNHYRSSPIEAHTRGKTPAVLEFLDGLQSAPSRQARFLNTLSLLEHIGSRKIMLTQSRGPLGGDVLQHLSEEARHAMFFRKAAEKLAGRPLSFEASDLIAPEASRMYFGRLDARISAELGEDSPLAYPYVTAAIELRAFWLYELYDDVLRAQPHGISLKGVLAEETRHLEDILRTVEAKDPDFELRLEDFTSAECRYFDRWFDAVRGAR